MNLFRKHDLDKYIAGCGLEIGALDNPLKVKRRTAQILYIDLADRDSLINQNPETPAERIKQPDIIASAEDLSAVKSNSMDFVIACHVLEHLPNPLSAVKEFHRVLKPEGILYLSIPDKRYTFDSERPVTPLSHICRDYEEGATAYTCLEHYREWIDFVECRKKNPVIRTVEEAKHYRIHFHVWVPDSILDILQFVSKNLQSSFVLADYYYKDGDTEVVFILKKSHSYSITFMPPLIERYSMFRAVLHKAAVLSRIFT